MSRTMDDHDELAPALHRFDLSGQIWTVRESDRVGSRHDPSLSLVIPDACEIWIERGASPLRKAHELAFVVARLFAADRVGPGESLTLDQFSTVAASTAEALREPLLAYSIASGWKPGPMQDEPGLIFHRFRCGSVWWPVRLADDLNGDGESKLDWPAEEINIAAGESIEERQRLLVYFTAHVFASIVLDQPEPMVSNFDAGRLTSAALAAIREPLAGWEVQRRGQVRGR